MTLANVPVEVAMGQTDGTRWQPSGAVFTAYFSRVPCVGEWVWIVDDGLHGRVAQVDWRFDDSAALVDRERVRLLLSPDSP